ncbi:MAG: DNA topoisomerase III [Haliea sp.]
MRLFIAEKPSLARAIAAVLPGPQQRHKTHINSGDANVVVWCAGHVLTQYMPEDYHPEYERWSLEHLPILPEHWAMKISPRTRDLYNTIKQYAKQAIQIVHAGDPDREGQLVVDEVLDHLGITGIPVKRVLISDLNPPAVRRAIGAMQDNNQYRGLRDAALGRARADWAYGLNLTRLYTLRGRQAGLSGVLSVGRVQTPVLGLVVRRDRAIEAFEPRPYYQVEASIITEGGNFMARWVPGEQAESYLDSEGRVVDRGYGEAVAAAAAHAEGRVERYQRKKVLRQPPLPFSLPELQKAASKQFGLSARRTLDVAQSLYETYKLLTYPRSDCSYLPEEHHHQAPEVREAIVQTLGEAHQMNPLVDSADLIHRGPCWNDAKITAHHAIIPTTKGIPLEALSRDEQLIYTLVAHRYLLQFQSPRELEQVQVNLVLHTVNGPEAFRAKNEIEQAAGWHAWRQVLTVQPANGEREAVSDEESTRGQIPALAKGQGVQATDCQVVDKIATPPKRFTEASLLDAMTGVARFVEDPRIKKVLRDTDGLGTPATQATILDTLFKRGYLEKHKKTVLSTALGRALIDALPEYVTLPDMTALWELNLSIVADGDETLGNFMASITGYVEELVLEGGTGLQIPKSLQGKHQPGASKRKGKGQNRNSTAHLCSREGCVGMFRRIKGEHGYFWGCSEYRNGCGETRQDSRGKPSKASSTKKTAPS